MLTSDGAVNLWLSHHLMKDFKSLLYTEAVESETDVKDWTKFGSSQLIFLDY